jgi:hypothetical protein
LDSLSAAIKAGGIDLLDLMKERINSPTRLVNIRNVVGLDRIAGDAASGLKSKSRKRARSPEKPGYHSRDATAST